MILEQTTQWKSLTKLLAEEDWKSYRALRHYCLRESPYAFSTSIFDEINRSEKEYCQELAHVGDPAESFVMGLFHQNALIGFLRFVRDARQIARHKGMLHTMYISDQYRNRGLGRVLMDGLLSHLQTIKGLNQIHLWVLLGKSSASQFYKISDS